MYDMSNNCMSLSSGISQMFSKCPSLSKCSRYSSIYGPRSLMDKIHLNACLLNKDISGTLKYGNKSCADTGVISFLSTLYFLQIIFQRPYKPLWNLK